MKNFRTIVGFMTIGFSGLVEDIGYKILPRELRR